MQGMSRAQQTREEGMCQGNAGEAGVLGTGKKDIEEVESTSERLGAREKTRKEPHLILRFQAETTGPKPHQPAPAGSQAERRV